jgi:transcriptional regulator with XRE-family HTH domain
LSTKSGVTVSTISRLENGLQAARISTIRKLAEAVSADADDLIDWEQPGPVMGGRGKAAA